MGEGIRVVVSDFVRFQAEWWDGSGAPQGVKGRQIPLASRIIAVVDQYGQRLWNTQSMTMDTISLAPEAGVGTQLDPDMVSLVLNRRKDSHGMRDRSADIRITRHSTVPGHWGKRESHTRGCATWTRSS